MEPCCLGVAWPSSACTTWALVKDTGPGPQPTPLDPNLQIHTRPTAAKGQGMLPLVVGYQEGPDSWNTDDSLWRTQI